jgi:hypothetical protein
MQTTDLKATDAAGGFATSVTKNDNTGDKVFDLVAKTSANWLIGAEKVETILEFGAADKEVDWKVGRSVL